MKKTLDIGDSLKKHLSENIVKYTLSIFIVCIFIFIYV